MADDVRDSLLVFRGQISIGHATCAAGLGARTGSAKPEILASRFERALVYRAGPANLPVLQATTS